MTLSQNLIRLFSRYSEGCRLAAEHGSHSGIVFEYACDNSPHGSGPLGRWIDRGFLRVSGGFNLRRQLDAKKKLLRGLIDERRENGTRTTVLDVASGTGRALRELCREHDYGDVTIVCHDRDPRKVMQGRELIAREQLANVTFAVGDATDPASYLVFNDPDIILAMGLFPLLQRDDAVRTVIRLAFEHLREGGQFLCTTARHSDPTARRWDSPVAPPAVNRPADVVAGWMRATGYVDTRTISPDVGEAIVVGTKPVEA